MLKQNLEKIFPPDRLLFSDDDFKKYGKDWTTYFDIKAKAIVFPLTAEEIQILVLWARENKIALIPSGGRTGLSGGACAINGEVIVSFEKMNQILEFNSVDQTVKVQAGVITETLQDFAKTKNLFYPVDFAARGSSQIGGNIATNAGGIKVVRYGLTRNWIASLKVVTGTGDILELNNSLIKNATGYDFRHLFIGSEGTLGFVVEATIQLCPPPPPLQVLIMGLPNLDSIMKLFSQFKEKTSLTAFEMFSHQALSYVLKSTGLSQPLPTACPYYVVAEVEAVGDLALEKVLSVFETALESGLVLDGTLSQSKSQAKIFWRYREDIAESLSKFSPYKNDISVTISQVPTFMNDLDDIFKKSYPTWEVIWYGHIGDGNLHISILRPQNLSKEAFVHECRKVDELVFSAIQKRKGSISAEHGVGLTKKPFLKYSRSDAEITLMKNIKKVFDPDHIMNPGKLLD